MSREIPFNCPYCGRALSHQSTRGEWRFYSCEKCGPITLPPGEPHRRTEATDYVVDGPKNSAADLSDDARQAMFERARRDLDEAFKRNLAEPKRRHQRLNGRVD